MEKDIIKKFIPVEFVNDYIRNLVVKASYLDDCSEEVTKKLDYEILSISKMLSIWENLCDSDSDKDGCRSSLTDESTDLEI